MYLLPPEKLTWYVYAGELGLEDDDDDLPPDPNPNPRPRPILRNSMRSIGSDRRRVRSRVVNLGTRFASFASFASSASSASSIPNATRRDDTADDTADTDDKKMSRAIITSSAARDVRSDRDPPRRSRPGHPSIHRVPSIVRSLCGVRLSTTEHTHTHRSRRRRDAPNRRDDGDRDGRRRRRRWRRR